MKKLIVINIGSTLVLLGIVELYFWTQGRAEGLDGTWMKIGIVTLYLLMAVISAYAASRASVSGLGKVVVADLIVATTVVVGITLLVSTVHTGVAKDAVGNVGSLVTMLLLIVGSATFAARVVGSFLGSRVQERTT